MDQDHKDKIGVFDDRWLIVSCTFAARSQNSKNMFQDLALIRRIQRLIYCSDKYLPLVLIWTLASCAIAASASVAQPDFTDRPALHFGVLAFRPKTETLRRWQPVADYLGQKIPTHRVVLEAFDYPELEQAIRDRRVDLVLTQPAHYVALSVQQNLYSPLATLVESELGHALSSIGGVILTKSNNDNIVTIADLKPESVT